VGLLRLYHDYVLYKSKHPVDFVVGSWNERVNRFARIPLSLISHVQVAAEAIAEYRGGDVAKWRMVCLRLNIVGMVNQQLLICVWRIMNRLYGLKLLSVHVNWYFYSTTKKVCFLVEAR
jgi:hypothetical protein